VAGAPTPCTLRDGLEASWLAEVCTLSWREHRPVKLGEIR
jgi:myo-inositol 2-dehydrogenase / D-chiro-inositol 1-dehydrogenase